MTSSHNIFHDESFFDVSISTSVHITNTANAAIIRKTNTMMGIMVFVFLIIAAFAVFVIWTLVDMLTSKNDSSWKILWLLVIVLLPLLGSVLYYFIGRGQKAAKKKTARK